MEISRISIFRSLKANTAPPADPFWPFDRVATVIEGQNFVKTISSPEDYFILKSRIVEGSDEHWHVSIDRLSLACLFAEILEAESPRAPPKASVLEMLPQCVSLSICYIQLRVPDLYLGGEISNFEFLSHQSHASSVLDIRMDPVEFVFDGGDGPRTIQKKALTPCLDPHYKSFVLSVQQCVEKKTVSCSLSGSLLMVPLYADLQKLLSKTDDFFQVREGPDPQSRPSVPSDVFVHFDACSIQNEMQRRFQEGCPPHAIYAESIKVGLVHKSTPKIR